VGGVVESGTRPEEEWVMTASYEINKVFTGYVTPKVPTRRSLSKNLRPVSTNAYISKVKEIALEWLKAQPPRTALFGTKATIIKGWIQSPVGPKKQITFDSGSEITLINKSLLRSLEPPHKVQLGQKLYLIQVTSNSSFSQYITVSFIFDTSNRPVRMTVEAYVVPDMNTPFILGMDFAAQYQLSLVRKEMGTSIVFGDMGQSISVEESDSTPRIDRQGNAFLVQATQGYIQNSLKQSHARKQY
jgi:hypothetical protein